MSLTREILEAVPAAFYVNREYRKEYLRVWKPVLYLRSIPHIYVEAGYLRRPIYYDECLHTYVFRQI
jgi:hypothetical protein